MKSKIKIFKAKKIITMHQEQPFAEAVAVMDGRILGTGDAAGLEHALKQSDLGDFEIDDRFRDKILMPGLVDPHTHVELQAVIYSGNFVSQIPWPDPQGGFFPVYPTKQDVLDRLKALDKSMPPGELLYGAAYDDNKAAPFDIGELDTVSKKRPILISNLVFHRFWCNSALIEKAGINTAHPPEGVRIGKDGNPDGTLIEMHGLMSILPALTGFFDNMKEKIDHILPLFHAAGNTTVCDAAFGAAFGLELSAVFFDEIFGKNNAGLRVVGLPWASGQLQQGVAPSEFIKQLESASASASDNFRIGAVKLYTDGSLISKTAPNSWPGYWDEVCENQMAFPPENIHEWLIACHKAGIPTVTHTNTDLGCQIVLDAVKEAQCICYRPDIRHRMDHCYTITEAQLRQAKNLGVNIQFFTPQLYYYGDSHIRLLGPDRARHLTPVGTAKRIGVSWGFHNDPPGTPQLPWVGAHSVINRLTADTQTLLGPEHRATIKETLRAMTIEAAFQMHLDHEIGSIAAGKKADFCVLEADPLKMDPLEIKDMPVWGTVFGGRPQCGP